MNRIILSIGLLAFLSVAASAQTSSSTQSLPAAPSSGTAASTIPPPPAIDANTNPVELARAALAAQGGDKFKALKNVWIYGCVNLYAPNSTQAVPGKFSLVTAGS